MAPDCRPTPDNELVAGGAISAPVWEPAAAAVAAVQLCVEARRSQHVSRTRFITNKAIVTSSGVDWSSPPLQSNPSAARLALGCRR